MNTQELIERIYDHVESGQADKAAVASLRLARKVGDSLNAIMFLRELYPDVHQMKVAFFEETMHLKPEARDSIWKITQDRWIEERTLAYSLSEDQERNVLAMGAGELLRDVEQTEKSIEDLRLPEGMGEFDTAAFTDRHAEIKGQMRLKIRACHTILERIRTRCLHYATRMEQQLSAAARAADFMGNVQNDVHNYYAERCEGAYRNRRKAADLISSNDPEDHALLLTSIRRAVRAVADHHFPAQSGLIRCSDGKMHEMGEEQYLNRLQEFCHAQTSGNSTGQLLRAEMDYLAVFIRRLNDVASKGVHAEVTSLEAKQGLMGVYMFLSNLLAKLAQQVQSDTGSHYCRPEESS